MFEWIVLMVCALWAVCGLTANAITFKRMGRESRKVHELRVAIIEGCAFRRDFSDIDARLATAPYPAENAYGRVMVRTLLLRKYDDILPFSTKGE